MQKEIYPVSKGLQQYLQDWKRDIDLPIRYQSLFHYRYTDAIKDKNGKHTHWENVVYEEQVFSQLQQQLIETFCKLKNQSVGNYAIDAIHFCEFANSMPFRITITDTETEMVDFFYIKLADASRIYGLELEQLLSPNPTHFFCHQNTLVEEHIEGIPGDIFLETVHHLTDKEKQLLAETFIRFNERCFARLLGDMRSYNFVIVKTSLVEQPFHIKAIDFDQQCYEGKMNLYLPQFYKENYPYVQMCMSALSDQVIEEVRLEERRHLAELVQKNDKRLNALFNVLVPEEIAENYKVTSLAYELNQYFTTHQFSRCKTMGALVKAQLNQLLSINI